MENIWSRLKEFLKAWWAPPQEPLPPPVASVQTTRERVQTVVEKPKERYERLGKCPVSGKLSRTEVHAKNRAKELGMRAYLCMFCPNWHLTHKKDNIRKH